MRMSLSQTLSRGASLVILAGCSVGLAAQQPAAGNSQTTPAPKIHTLHATTRIVYVDVVVRDGNGHIVHGLPESSFSVLENKTPQHISLFEEHRSEPIEAAASLSTRSGVDQLAAAATEPISNVPHVAPDTPLDMVLLDLIDTAPHDQQFARARMITFLQSMPPGRRVALFILSNGLHMVQGFTTDSAELARAAQNVDVRLLDRLRTPGQQITDKETEAGVGGFLAGAITTDLALNDQQNMKVRLDVAYQAFKELADAVNGIPGRKNLFWLAGEFPSDIYYTLQNLSSNTVAPPAPAMGSAGNFSPGSGGAAGPDLALHPFGERFNQVVGDSQIAVYPINVTGVQTDSVGAQYSGAGSALGAQPDTAATFFNERADDHLVMNHIADETGGEAFYGNNDPAGMLRRGFEDGENYYTLAYQPTDHDWNGAYRKIAVKMAARGYHLAYRRGYFALPTQPRGNPLQEFASAMRLETPPSTMLTVSALPPAKVSPGVMQFNATLDLHGIGFVSDPANTSADRKAKLQILLIAYPLGGDLTHAAEINNALSLGLTSTDYTRVLQSGIPLRQTLHLKPGRYAIRFGVLDPISGRIGTLTLPFTMPAG